MGSDSESESGSGSEWGSDFFEDYDAEEELKVDPPPVKVLLFSFMFMFQGYGAMVGIPEHALRHEMGMDASEEQEKLFLNGVASIHIAKMVMRIAQIAFLVFFNPRGIVLLSYVVMFCAVCVPMVCVWWLEIHEMWVVYLQYMLGGAAIGLFEGTFLSVISTLGKDTKTFAIMGAPLGFGVHNIILGTFSYYGMNPLVYYIYTAACLPIAAYIFHVKAPAADAKSSGKGCAVFMNSIRHCSEWVPRMMPFFAAKAIGNFVLEDGFPLLFSTFNTKSVPILGGPAATSPLMPFALYCAWIWFPSMMVGDTISRRVPAYLSINRKRDVACYLTLAIAMCVGGESLTFLLTALVTALATFIANFGNGFIYGLSAKFIDSYIAEEHRYAAYNLWCFIGDLGGYVGASSMSKKIGEIACGGKNYTYVCYDANATKPVDVALLSEE